MVSVYIILIKTIFTDFLIKNSMKQHNIMAGDKYGYSGFVRPNYVHYRRE